MSSDPLLSIVLATHNRREVVLNTVRQLGQASLSPDDCEVIVVDNASADGTARALRGRLGVIVQRLDQNLGSCAKAIGVEHARGQIILFLDDDSYPRPGSLNRMLAHFAADPELGAAGFMVHLPDGSQECSALPHVFVGCGVGLRASALKDVGGLDLSFFMQAEEYDLSFRLLAAGWKVQVFGDLHAEHAKSPTARRSERTALYDVCNNLRVIARYLPSPWAEIYREDCLQRYGWLADRAGHSAAFQQGLEAGERCARVERRSYRRWQLSPLVLEQVFCWERIERRMAALLRQGVRRVVLADLGKNVYAFHRAAAAVGIEVLAVADDHLHGPRRTYRGTPLLSTAAALQTGADACVVSNTSYVHAQRRWRELSGRAHVPICNWFTPPAESDAPVPALVLPPVALAQHTSTWAPYPS